MISLLSEEVIGNGWLAEDEFLNFIAVSESTPGPIAVNLATFVGSSQGGILGALCATLGVVLPSFIIILLIASVLTGLLKKPAVEAALGGIMPVIAGMVIATALTMLFSLVLGIGALPFEPTLDLRATIILLALIIASILCKKILKKSLSPIAMILLSAVLGLGLYALPIG